MNFNVTSKEAKTALFKFVTAACKKNIEPYFVPSKALLNAITLKKKKKKPRGHFCSNTCISGVKHKNRNCKFSLRIQLEKPSLVLPFSTAAPTGIHLKMRKEAQTIKARR